MPKLFALVIGLSCVHAAAPPAPVAVVETLPDLFKLVEHSVTYATWSTGIDSNALLASRLAGFTLSTSFSGIGAPEVALYAMTQHFGIPRTTSLFAIEWDQD